MLFAVASQAVRCPTNCQKENVGGRGLSGLQSDFLSQLCKLSTGEAQHRLALDRRPAQAQLVRAPCRPPVPFPPVLGLRGAEGQQTARPQHRAFACLGAQASRLHLGAFTMFRFISHVLDCIFAPRALCGDGRQGHFITLCCGNKPRDSASASGVPFVGPGRHHLLL